MCQQGHMNGNIVQSLPNRPHTHRSPNRAQSLPDLARSVRRSTSQVDLAQTSQVGSHSATQPLLTSKLSSTNSISIEEEPHVEKVRYHKMTQEHDIRPSIGHATRAIDIIDNCFQDRNADFKSSDTKHAVVPNGHIIQSLLGIFVEPMPPMPLWRFRLPWGKKFYC